MNEIPLGSYPEPHVDEPLPDPSFINNLLHLTPNMTDAQVLESILAAPADQIIPWEKCKLPSLGLFYPTWHGESFCEVRAWGQQVDKIMSNQRLAQSGESLDYLFRECCRFPDANFDPMDLLAGDRVYLLYYTRGITHGPKYEFAVTCPFPTCKNIHTHTFDLTELQNTCRFGDPSNCMEPFRVALPYLSKIAKREVWASLRFVRGRDTNNMTRMKRVTSKLMAAPAARAGRNAQRRHTEPTVDDTLTENLHLVIQDINGINDRDKITTFVEKMHSTDLATIREWLRDNSPGIDTAITLNCPDCGQEFTVELPLSESFFRPAKDK